MAVKSKEEAIAALLQDKQRMEELLTLKDKEIHSLKESV